MLRKCIFILLAIFLRQYGTALQVVAAALVLIVVPEALDQDKLPLLSVVNT